MPAGLPYVGWVTRPDKNGQPPPCFGQCTLNIGARKVGAAMKRLPQLQYGDKAKEQFFQKWDPVSKRLVKVVFRDILLVLSSRSLTLTPSQATVGYTSNDLSRQTNTVIRDALGEIYATDIGLNENAGTYSKNYAGTVYGNETYTSTLSLYNGTQFSNSESYSVNANTTVPNLTLDVTTGIMSSANWTISSGQIRSGQYQFVNNSNTNSTTGGTVVSTQLYPSSGAPYTRGDVSPYYLDPSTLWNFYYGQLVLPDASFVTSPSATRYIPIAALTSLSANSVSDVFSFTWAITPNPWPLESSPVITFELFDASNTLVSVASFTTSLLSGSRIASQFDITNQNYTVRLSITDPLSAIIPIQSSGLTLATSFSFGVAPTVSQVSGTSATVGWTDPCNARLDVYESVNSALVDSAEFSIGSITTLAANTFPTTQTIAVPTINPSRYYFSRIRARDFGDTTDVATSGYSNAAAGRFTRAYTNVLNGGGATSNFSSFELSSSSANPYVYTLQSPDSVTALSPYFVNDGSWSSTNTERYMVIGEVGDSDVNTRYSYFVDGPTISYKSIDITNTSGAFSGSLTTLSLTFPGGNPTTLSGIAYDSVGNNVFVASRDLGKIYRIANIRTGSPTITTLLSSGLGADFIRAMTYDSATDTIYISVSSNVVRSRTGARTLSGQLLSNFAIAMDSVTGVVGIALSPDNNTLYAYGTSGIFSNTSPRLTTGQTALSGLSSSVVGATAGVISIDSDNNMHICSASNASLIRASLVGDGSVIESIQMATIGTIAGVCTFSGASNNTAIVATTTNRYSKSLAV